MDLNKGGLHNQARYNRICGCERLIPDDATREQLKASLFTNDNEFPIGGGCRNTTPSSWSKGRMVMLFCSYIPKDIHQTHRTVTNISARSFSNSSVIGQQTINELEYTLFHRNARSMVFLGIFCISAQSQTTVGYRDMQPNSTVVRMIVVGQILTGLLILGIALKFAFS